MNRSRITLLFGAVLLMAASNVPQANTRDAVKAYVQSAAKVVQQHGASCDTFKTKDWAGGDYYITVVGPDGNVLCHPNSQIVGRANASIIDANGTKVGVGLIDAATKGGGWFDYVWPRPGDTKPVAKSSYAMRAKGPDGKWYVVMAGGYGIK